MLQIEASHVDAVNKAKTVVDLHEALQGAAQLEHATIPPYLLAAYSLKDGANSFIRRTLLEIAKEEMLHMAIICNVLNAVGGRPRIGEQDFLPLFPGPLPLAIRGGLTVGLRMYSPELVDQMFMEIEEPEKPIRFEVLKSLFNFFMPPKISTIGAFYRAIIEKIQVFGDAAFTGNPARQVAGQETGFPVTDLFPIGTSDEAVRAMARLVQDGEGTTTSPFDGSGQLAHYYRFAELHHARRLVKDPDSAGGFSYSGDAILFDPAQVHAFPNDPKMAHLPAGSFEQQLVVDFNQRYCDMLRQLDRVFNGEPELIRDTNSKMIALRGRAVSAMQRRTPDGHAVAVTFEYMP